MRISRSTIFSLATLIIAFLVWPHAGFAQESAEADPHEYVFRVLHLFPNNTKPDTNTAAKFLGYAEEVRRYYGVSLGRTFSFGHPILSEHQLPIPLTDLLMGTALGNESSLVNRQDDPGATNLIRYVLENFVPTHYKNESSNGTDFLVFLDGVPGDIFRGAPGYAFLTRSAFNNPDVTAMVLAHEVGHALGLMHTPDTASCLEKLYGYKVDRPLLNTALMQPALATPDFWSSFFSKEELSKHPLLDFEKALLTQVDFPSGQANSSRCLALVNRAHPSNYLNTHYDILVSAGTKTITTQIFLTLSLIFGQLLT